MQINVIVAVITLLFLMASILGTAAAYYKSNMVKTQIDVLEGTNKAQADRIKFIEDEDVRKSAKIKSLEDAVGVLEKVVTGKELLDKILREVQSTKKEADTIAKKLFNDMEEVLDCCGEIKVMVSSYKKGGA